MQKRLCIYVYIWLAMLAQGAKQIFRSPTRLRRRAIASYRGMSQGPRKQRRVQAETQILAPLPD